MKARPSCRLMIPKPARFTWDRNSTYNPAMQRELVTVQRFHTDNSSNLQLHLVAGEKGLKRTIREPTVNRPGLVLTGFTRYFAKNRVQVIGNAEAYFLKSLSPEERQ